MSVAVLFARRDSDYKDMPGLDVFDIDRDARTWCGGTPVVAHPPCRAWGTLSQFAKPRPDERDLAILAVAHVRRFGGVLEHPKGSKLWAHCCLPRPGRMPDAWGGYTIEVRQFDWGHRAEKRTWLYIVGCHPDDLPPMPQRTDAPTHCIAPTRGGGVRLPTVTKREREATPPPFAEWLTEVARRCRRA